MYIGKTCLNKKSMSEHEIYSRVCACGEEENGVGLKMVLSRNDVVLIGHTEANTAWGWTLELPVNATLL